ncbi:MAG TPA: carbohydrate ABC transporter permease [Chloroflexota bacterium]|jgi:multiple sugar transport system permease protein|nr:carbohydrate ABC transporter permease [Chloroflexota bacterium]
MDRSVEPEALLVSNVEEARQTGLGPRPLAMAGRRRYSLGSILANLALAVLGLAFLFPLLWVVFAAFDSHASNALALPHPTLYNFTHIFQTGLVSQPFANSLYFSVISMVITTILALLAAYPLSRRAIPLKRPFLFTILFATGLPLNMLLVPVYSIYVSYNVIDSLSFAAIFFAATSIPFAIWLLKNFIDAVPIELEEAAQVDGASAFGVLWHIAARLILPGISVTAIFTFINAWSTFLVPYILLQSPNKLPSSITIYQFEGAYGIPLYGQLAAYCILLSLPVLALYWLVARNFAGAFNFGGGLQG